MDISKDFNLTVGLRIREIREAMQMTRERFSELCGISDSFLAAVESGKKSITSKTIYKICYNANISADYLIFGNKGGFECDTVLELLRQMDTNERDSAIRILTEFSVSLARAKSKKHTPAEF
ncbi:MAG: helix-turn-helix transcriptional regulator [Eubacterium sp.]|jgi:transcriptional regulator with XRE-family HTH domain|nr:helix-turn-helix transcriptional regulator [Eubacterium sp.]